MRGWIPVILTALMVTLAGTLMIKGAQATGSRVTATKAPRVSLLSRSYRWKWDPFRVEGDQAYAVAWITNTHQYALTLKTYCKDRGKMLKALSGWHLIAPGKTYQWDTRRLIREGNEDPKAVVVCQFWVDGSIDIRGRIVNTAGVRMGKRKGGYSVLTFNYLAFAPGKNG